MASTDDKLLHELSMVRSLADLESLPVFPLPDGYIMREFREGQDEAAWDELIQTVFGMPELSFQKHMKSDPVYAPERILFLCRGDVPVATAAWWWLPQYGENCGLVHMVAARPEEAGKKFGYILVREVLCRLKREGRTEVILNTNDYRLPALKTYLKLGFRPKYNDPRQKEVWDRIYETLHWKT